MPLINKGGGPSLSSFTSRVDNFFSAKNQKTMAKVVSEDLNLKDFVNECIVHLKTKNGSKDAKQIAYYLMGKTSKLPSDLQKAKVAIPKNVQPLLSDLLRTESFGLKKESNEKTQKKLEMLNDKLHSFAYTDFQLEPDN